MGTAGQHIPSSSLLLSPCRIKPNKHGWLHELFLRFHRREPKSNNQTHENHKVAGPSINQKVTICSCSPEYDRGNNNACKHNEAIRGMPVFFARKKTCNLLCSLQSPKLPDWQVIMVLSNTNNTFWGFVAWTLYSDSKKQFPCLLMEIRNPFSNISLIDFLCFQPHLLLTFFSFLCWTWTNVYFLLSRRKRVLIKEPFRSTVK